MEHQIDSPPPLKQILVPPQNLPDPSPTPPPKPLPEPYTPPLFLKNSTIYILILTGITVLIILAYYLFS